MKSTLIFAISVLLSGLSYSVVKFLFNFNCIYICSEKEFYYYQKIVVPVINSMAKKSAKKYLEKMEENAIISIDGAWDHRRHGTTCIVTFIDINSRKIVDFEIAFQPKQFVDGNTEECSRNLEKVCIERLIERWESNQKVRYYTHDNDGVTRNVIDNSVWKVKEVLDIGHSIKSISNNLENFNNRNGKIFNGLMESIKRFFNTLFRDKKISKEKRIQLYFKMVNHYTGKHKNCSHDKAIRKIREY